MKSTRIIEFLTTMPAPAINPIIDVAVKNAPRRACPGSMPMRESGMGAIMTKGIMKDLNQPTIVTAYENGKAVHSTLAITGIGGWETPPGTYSIQQRVENERMRGPGWDVSNVLFTQYFTGEGHAIHYNYWSSSWGYQGSRGCLGMTYDDALWFWEWATIGTPVVIHW